MGTPIKYAIIGAVAALAGFFLSRLLGLDTAASWWLIIPAGAVGGFVGGWLKDRKGS
jgi:uncharacterized membrane protein YeaQ/YmgE (transglycosylase-associated protein family)